MLVTKGHVSLCFRKTNFTTCHDIFILIAFTWMTFSSKYFGWYFSEKGFLGIYDQRKDHQEPFLPYLTGVKKYQSFYITLLINILIPGINVYHYFQWWNKSWNFKGMASPVLGTRGPLQSGPCSHKNTCPHRWAHTPHALLPEACRCHHLQVRVIRRMICLNSQQTNANGLN